jgi:hypothetical protein
VNTIVTIAVVAAGLLLAVWSGVMCLRDRPVDTPQLVGSAVLLVLGIVQLVVGIVVLAGGEKPAGGTVTFVSYLVGCVLVPPAATFLGLVERSRWGSAIIGAGGLVVPVLVMRLNQVWEMAGA